VNAKIKDLLHIATKERCLIGTFLNTLGEYEFIAIAPNGRDGSRAMR
jgi:hypothetical protein